MKIQGLVINRSKFPSYVWGGVIQGVCSPSERFINHDKPRSKSLGQ